VSPERHRRVEHWSNASFQGAEVGRSLAGDSGGYDTVSTFFTEIFGLTLKVFGDLSVHDELVIRGSHSDRNLLGFYHSGAGPSRPPASRDQRAHLPNATGSIRARGNGSQNACSRSASVRPSLRGLHARSVSSGSRGNSRSSNARP
jgi:hypothetical protein